MKNYFEQILEITPPSFNVDSCSESSSPHHIFKQDFFCTFVKSMEGIVVHKHSVGGDSNYLVIENVEQSAMQP